MIAAVTGGTGFIGKKLVARLVERGDTVRLLTRSPNLPDHSSLLEMHECDLLTAEVSELSTMLDGVGVLYHCAGQLKEPLAMRALHVDATRKLAEAASRRIGRWVQLSSVGVYGSVPEGAITEDSALNPFGEYEITKTESDKIVVDAASKGGFSYSILRPSNVFGAEMANQSLFGMIAMIDRGLFLYIGKPGASANYIHVDNVIEGLVSCGTMQQAECRIYNLSDHCTLEHFVGTIATRLGRPAPRLRIPAPLAYLAGEVLGGIPGFPLTRSRVEAMVNRSVYPISRIQQELGYHHVTSMEDGLLELVEAYKQRAEHRGAE
ncbi:NAD(P)-dependent oxidoreductase [Devosia sp.]|uniref:NAD-dependent epimerase/dehydratase family protein n=1 Tax=Devosia sp. TaxID=1871048 RepID=UPI0027355973|nr:NAD-dependent epimerase/dehydratase family protein [Devosia sp.]MDP2782480.1 NAD-dependent epimerase/dehydratase family protein [Devosia sp.]